MVKPLIKITEVIDMKHLICPLSPERINGQVARLTAAVMLVLLVFALLLRSDELFFVIALDYAIRGWTSIPQSPGNRLASRIADAFHLEPYNIDKAPKIFAARVGFLFAASALLLLWLAPTAGLIVGGTLLLFATLEAVFDFCMGCLVYTVFVFPAFGRR